MTKIKRLAQQIMKYPLTRRDETKVGKYFEKYEIKDFYQHLEDPDGEETMKFVKDQNELTSLILSRSTVKEKFKSRLTQLMDYAKFGCPIKRGSNFYHFYNSGLQAQSVLRKQSGLDQDATTFFDPNVLSEDGTVSLNTYSFSKSGEYFAHALSESGSDWVKVFVKSVETGENIGKPLKWVKFTSLEWTHENKGFFYKSYPKPKTTEEKAGTETDKNEKCSWYYHLLNTSQEEDITVYTDSDPDSHPSISVSEDGKYLVLTITKSCDPNARVLYAKTQDFLQNLPKEPEFKVIVDNFDNAYSFITNDDNLFWFETTLDAPKKRIVQFDINSPEKGFVEIVGSTSDVIDFITVVDENKLVVCRLEDVKHKLSVYDLYSGKYLYAIPLPVGSMITGLTGRREDKIMFYNVSSYTSPSTTYKFDFASGQQSLFRETEIKGFDSSSLETRQVFYESFDGTKIPMYILSKKGVALDGSNPLLLYGYGGFNISITPSFSATYVAFCLHLGGIVAVANIRGGSEYGNDWYYNGRLDKKQNVFDDFQAAAKYLVAKSYTSHSKIVINGGSNGGLLVGACVNQAPELFGMGISEVGVLDMLKFHKFTIGHAWVSDYGNPDVESDFETLVKYSPLHNVKKQEYPAILIMTGDHDDRVVPLHSLKFLAELQHQATNDIEKKPILGLISTKAGHGAGKTTQQRIDEAAKKYGFIALQFELEWKD